MVHQKIIDAHRAAGYELVLRSEHRVEAWFSAITSGQPKKYHADCLYRIKSGGYGTSGKEYLYYHQTITSNDEFGDKKTFSSYIGKVEVPTFSYQYDHISKRSKATGIEGWNEEYEIPFSVEKLEEMENSGMIDERTACAFHGRGRIYSIDNYNDFRNRSYDDLLYYLDKHEWPSTADKSKEKSSK